MFVALRDLRFARGRFLLIGSVVGLITVLVGFLSGLTGGLAIQNISAVLAIPGDRVVFSAPSSGEPGASFSDSVITEQQATDWASTAGVTAAQPIGISQTRGEAGDTRTAIAVFGVQPGFNDTAPTADGKLGLSTPAADALNVTAGDTVTIAGTPFTVDTIAGDAWYSHTPVVEMTLTDWQAYSAATGNPDAYATVLAVSGSPDWDAADTAHQTVSESVLGSLTALSAFRSEIGSLLLMVAMLFGISGLVIGAFFTVWTMQRKGDIAVLKALGASTRSLVRDALGQALIVLLLGIGVGLGLVALFGALAGTALPFLLSPITTLLPGVIMIALGLAGAAFALRSVTSADPLTALGSNR
ncbi:MULTISPECIES: FtsX-like permease family protein [unclassified Microbacterium]|uniref:FtsX-like permease family protein n=1 Tax=unclassified Microbacterium TaxID=2609290 RepID=UPI000C3E5A95|nr:MULTISPECIES: FtsX-like permease family protein [unclassified Microbacterium]MAY50526.1 ABC transporter substrate-binding protein [Microbacterium sp.]HAS32394.1 ABC transporter substrate-binding protein [Microbacterium sp.]|tara:strand:+ start:50107 stop:51177 length:1071 start_codon:yes stop_codon:yes gene_type:complete